MRLGILLAVAGWTLLSGCLHKGEFGDAPDRSMNAVAGYYGVANPPAKFPVSQRTPSLHIPTNDGGIHTLRGDQVFIDNILGIPPFVPPSIEKDIHDSGDPDGCSNNRYPPFVPGDWDVENASFNPCSNGTPSVGAGQALPNGFLFVLPLSLPPMAFFGTSIYSSVNWEADAYWNLLLDNNQDGEWWSNVGQGSVGDEWVVRNQKVRPSPTGTFVVSPWFRFGVSEEWGALALPMWARNAATTAPVPGSGNGWDGSGPRSGLASGEIEDYFLEWAPIGQQPADAASKFPRPVGADLPKLSCPEKVALTGGAGEFSCQLPQANWFKGALISCLNGADTKAAATGTAVARITDGQGKACSGAADVTAQIADGRITVRLAGVKPPMQVLVGLNPVDGRRVTVGWRVALQ